jgi:glycoside/pentoside/hexuronide:cation symporter, GPH family
MKASQGWRYGLLGLPLAFAALPLYVQLPAYYAREFGVPLASLGILLLVARLADGFLDPWIGRWTDARFARSPLAVLGAAAVAALLLALGMAALFLPPVRGEWALLFWAGLSLGVTYLAYSVLTVMHQSWGAMLGGDEAQRARITGWREALGLAGVLIASLAPTLVGWTGTLALLALALAAGWLAWSRSPQPAVRAHIDAGSHAPTWRMPFGHPGFRKLLAVYMLNGIAAAVPATLLLFFVRDLLQSSDAAEPVYLGTYFLSAACSMPLWLVLVRRYGLARSWLAGMGLSVAAFMWAAALGPGDTTAFTIICALCGLALGADLALPGALLAGLIHSVGERGRGEGIFFGWWNAAAKLNLALAAGVALPLLSFAGYAPGLRTAEALTALTLAYCVLPCVLKSTAAALLYFTLIRKERPT